ncbi:MAG: hypothetical protein ACK56I_36040, partial [bacterium]
LAELDSGAADLLQQPVHIPVGEHPAAGIERRGFKDVQGAMQSVCCVVTHHSGLEQLPAVGRNRQCRVMAALMHQTKQREQPWPGAPGAGKTTATPSRCLLQLLKQTTNAIGPVVKRVV